MSPEVDRRLVLAFEGTVATDDVRALLRKTDASGVTLFRPTNVSSVEQVRELTDALQRTAGDADPLLVAVDQEGGQLLGLGAESTPFAGNMALGAAGDEALAERVGAAIGRELRATGVNVNYAPVCDVATDPGNPSLGIRSFGDDPASVGRLAAATVRGLRSTGVAATLKHFPGKGDATVDPHHAIPRLEHDRARLSAVELPPFRAGIEAGADLVMIGHYDVPSVTERPGLPSSLSGAIVTGLLRGELGFDGRRDLGRARHARAPPGRTPRDRRARRAPRGRRPPAVHAGRPGARPDPRRPASGRAPWADRRGRTGRVGAPRRGAPPVARLVRRSPARRRGER
ncbi:MAG: glycoside hydrolase family 3 protein [Actinomycetota bacterium]